MAAAAASAAEPHYVGCVCGEGTEQGECPPIEADCKAVASDTMAAFRDGFDVVEITGAGCPWSVERWLVKEFGPCLLDMSATAYMFLTHGIRTEDAYGELDPRQSVATLYKSKLNTVRGAQVKIGFGKTMWTLFPVSYVARDPASFHAGSGGDVKGIVRKVVIVAPRNNTTAVCDYALRVGAQLIVYGSEGVKDGKQYKFPVHLRVKKLGPVGAGELIETPVGEWSSSDDSSPLRSQSPRAAKKMRRASPP